MLLVACSGPEEEPYEDRSVDSIYNSAMEELLDQNYVVAAREFEEVERQHPYSVWAAKAQIMGAYAYFRKDQYDSAINAVDRFIQLHPTNADAPYAYYLKSLAYYEQIVDVGRDQRTTERALDALQDVVRRFPETQYARDASLKLDLTRDHLAGKEMSVGRFYLKRGEIVAAINRFKSVVEAYQTTTHVPEALLRLTEAYKALGLGNEARRMAAILGHNYPGSPWYADAYELVEGVKLEDFPRPDPPPFYRRWVNPDATIAKAERRDIPVLTPNAPESVVTAVPPGLPGSTEGAAPAAPSDGDTPAVAAAPTPSISEPAQPPAQAPETAGPAAPVTTVAPPPEEPTATAALAAPEAPEAPVAPIPAAPAAPVPQDPVVRDLSPAPAPPDATEAPARASALTAAERTAFKAEAESQRLAALEASGEWRRTMALAEGDEAQSAARAKLALALASVEYWGARGAVAAAETPEAEAAAERLLAERSVDYWRAARGVAETPEARAEAEAALAQAQTVLNYWLNVRQVSALDRPAPSPL